LVLLITIVYFHFQYGLATDVGEFYAG
jgi:hypothetical protein